MNANCLTVFIEYHGLLDLLQINQSIFESKIELQDIIIQH